MYCGLFSKNVFTAALEYDCPTRSIDGEWQPLTKARFTADANPVTNIDAGIDTHRFFLATGGDIENKTVPLRKQMELDATFQPKLPEGLPTTKPPVEKP